MDNRGLYSEPTTNIAFASFSVRIAFHDGQRLTVNVVDGENVGFSDTVDYEAIVVRKGIIVLSWQEQIGSTIVHVLDFTHARTHTCVTPANGGFLRLCGRLDAGSAATP